MGHLGRMKAEHRALARRLNAGHLGLPEPTEERARAGWQEILEILYPPEEAALAARLPLRPQSLEQLVARLGVPATELAPRLEAMCQRGVVMDLVSPRSGETKYLLAPPLGGFLEFSMMRAHDDIPKRRMAEALEAYCQGDDTFAREVFDRETVIGRALVREGALAGAPRQRGTRRERGQAAPAVPPGAEDERPEVVDAERATALLEGARARAVSLCYCRHTAEHLGHACDAPVEVCFSLNGGADFVIRRGFGRAVERTEALELLAQAREAGLAQIVDNVVNRPAYLCNCCGCCCEQLRAINRFGLDAVSPSGFEPVCDLQACKGCARCARTCPVAAITVVPERQPGRRQTRLVPRVDRDRCIGCGVCADACRNHALSMTRGSHRPTVPANSMERVVLMALERGHLGDLLFDEGGTRGGRFLGRVLDALTALDPVQQLLALEQVRSRFLQHTLGRLRRPRGG